MRFLLNCDYSDKRVFSRTCSPTVCSGGGQECTRQAESCWGQNQAGFRFENPEVAQGRKLRNSSAPAWMESKGISWPNKKWGKTQTQDSLVTTAMRLMKEILTRTAVLTSGHTFWIHRIKGWLRLEGTSGAHTVQVPTQAGPPRASCAQDCVQTAFQYP